MNLPPTYQPTLANIHGGFGSEVSPEPRGPRIPPTPVTIRPWTADELLVMSVRVIKQAPDSTAKANCLAKISVWYKETYGLELELAKLK